MHGKTLKNALKLIRLKFIMQREREIDNKKNCIDKLSWPIIKKDKCTLYIMK